MNFEPKPSLEAKSKPTPAPKVKGKAAPKRSPNRQQRQEIRMVSHKKVFYPSCNLSSN